MKSKIKTIIWGFLVLFLYLILINTIPHIDFSEKKINYTTEKSSGFNQKISFGSSLEITVERNRWYGKIIENGISQDIYFLGLIKLPKKHNGFNFVPLHIFFVLISTESLILLNKKWRSNENLG